MSTWTKAKTPKPRTMRAPKSSKKAARKATVSGNASSGRISYADFVKLLKSRPDLRDQFERDVEEGKPQGRSTKEYSAIVRFFAQDDAAKTKLDTELDRRPKKQAPKVPKPLKLKPPKGGKPGGKWIRLPPPKIEPEDIEPTAYAYRVEALVTTEFHDDTRGMLFLDKSDAKKAPPGYVVQFFWTKFQTRPEYALEQLRERVALLRLYEPSVMFLDITLYRISGSGPLREKHYQTLRSVDEPEKVKGW